MSQTPYVERRIAHRRRSQRRLPEAALSVLGAID